jgi:hypothetical protein
MRRKVFFLVTVDGDLRVGTRDQQGATIRAMRRVHAQLGLIGQTSWLINETDFAWTEEHAADLLELAASGECLGLHDHVDTHYAEAYEEALPLMRRARDRIAGFLKAAGYPATLCAHRNGCAIQSEDLYRAAVELGYSIVSDVWPGKAWSGRMVKDGASRQTWRRLEAKGIPMDNRAVAPGTLPWRHRPDNWLDSSSRDGPLLQVPITSSPWLERYRVRSNLAAGGPCAFVVLDTHPYDLQDRTTGEVSGERVRRYVQDLRWAKETLGASFIRLDEVPARLEEWTRAPEMRGEG